MPVERYESGRVRLREWVCTEYVGCCIYVDHLTNGGRHGYRLTDGVIGDMPI